MSKPPPDEIREINRGAMRYVEEGYTNEEGEFIRNGRTEIYDYRSVLTTVCYFRDDILHGEWISYYENGSVYVRTNHKNGKLEGIRTVYTTEGAVITEEFYSKGRCID